MGGSSPIDNSIDVGRLFGDEPNQWGLRGDPYLWQELRQAFEKEGVPALTADFNNRLNELYQRLIGEELGLSENVYIERYPPAGMSGGMVSSKFWKDIGFKLLLQRHRNLTTNKVCQVINTAFNFYSDAGGGDPDSTSPTLRNYHKLLWSRPLPNGIIFRLTTNRNGVYLYHNSSLGEFFFGSDAITHSYKNHKRKFWLTKQIPEDVDELFDMGSTIGGYIIFPNNRISGKPTINGARGCHGLIDDRFDLTLECIRRFYLGQESPLNQTLLRYRNFFQLFNSFADYVTFFLLDDLVDSNYNIKFYLPFDNFNSKPTFSCINDYLIYKQRVIDFVSSRNQRIGELFIKSPPSV